MNHLAKPLRLGTCWCNDSYVGGGRQEEPSSLWLNLQKQIFRLSDASLPQRYNNMCVRVPADRWGDEQEWRVGEKLEKTRTVQW